jgi:polyglycine hydrolase-like protein
MIMSIDTMSFILGGLLVAVALLGGGIEVRELKIPSVGRAGRVLSFIVGAIFIGLAIFLSPREKEKQPSADSAAPAAPQAARQPRERQPGRQPVKAEASEKAEWLTAAQYQQAFDKQVKEGFYPDKVEGRCESGTEQFHAEWKGIPSGATFVSHHGITKEFYERRNQALVSKGYSLQSLNTFKNCSGANSYQATWFKGK